MKRLALIFFLTTLFETSFAEPVNTLATETGSERPYSVTSDNFNGWVELIWLDGLGLHDYQECVDVYIKYHGVSEAIANEDCRLIFFDRWPD